MPDDIFDKAAKAKGDIFDQAAASHSSEAQQVASGLPQPQSPIPQGLQPTQSTGYLQHALTAPKMGLESGLPSPAQVPENVGPMQAGAIAGGALTNPLATAGSLGTSYLAGKGNRLLAKKLGFGEKGQNIAEGTGNFAGGIVGGSVGSAVDSPMLKWLTSSRSTGVQLLEQAAQKAGNAPVELSPETNKIVDQITEQGKLGGKVPKVISDLLERVGPSTKTAADAQPGPLTYSEARILQGNASELSAEEQMQLKGRLKYLIPQFAKSFANDVQAAADQAGIGTEHALGMKEYAQASARNRVLTKAANLAAKGAGVGATAYGTKEIIQSLMKR